MKPSSIYPRNNWPSARFNKTDWPDVANSDWDAIVDTHFQPGGEEIEDDVAAEAESDKYEGQNDDDVDDYEDKD